MIKTLLLLVEGFVFKGGLPRGINGLVENCYTKNLFVKESISHCVKKRPF
jgi:hypothetical protein